MNFDWQNLIVLACVTGSAAYLARFAWNSLITRRKSACGGCRNCGTGEKSRDVFSITARTANEKPH